MIGNKREYAADILAAAKYGFVIAVISSVLLILIGFFVKGFSFTKAVEIWRSGMCIASGITLFLMAGCILTKKSYKITKDSHWRMKFKKFNYELVIGIIAIILILFAAIADALTRISF